MNSDVKITYNNKDYNFQLAVDPTTKQRKWLVSDSSVLPPLLATDTPKLSQIPAEREIVIEQKYFNGGMGEEYYVPNSTRYHYSPGCDARRKGAVLLGPKYAKATINAAAVPTVTNAGFETAALAGWTVIDGTWTQSNTRAHTDTYSAKGLTGGGAGSPADLYQDITWNASYRNSKVTVTVWVYADNGGSCTVNVNDGVDNTPSAASTAAAWTQLTVTHTFNVAATQFRITLQVASAGDKITYWDDVAITAFVDSDIGAVSNVIDFAGSTYAADSEYLLKWNSGTTSWDRILSFQNAITDLCVWSSYLMIALGTANFYFYYDGTTLTQSNLDGFQYFGAVGVKLWGNSSTYQVMSSTNPLNGGSWSAATTVGSSNTTITNILTHPTVVLVAATDALWEIGATANTLLIPDLAQESDSNTGINSAIWHNSVYVPSGVGTLWEYDLGQDLITSITPAINIPGQAAFVGRILAIDGDPDFLNVIVEYGTKVEHLAGRWVGNDFLWHQLAEITLTNASNNVRSAKLSNTDSIKKLWLGCASTTDGIYYIHMPATSVYGDVTSDTDYKYQTSGYLYTGWLRGEYLYDLKTFYSIDIRTYGTAANQTIVVAYRLTDGGSWTTLATITSDVIGDPIIFPLNVTGTKIQLRFNLTTTDTADTPQLLDYTLYVVARPFGLDTSRFAVNSDNEFTTYGGQFTSWKHAEYPHIKKNFYAVEVLSSGLTDAKYISWQWRLDDDADWNPATFRSNTSPYDIFYFPAGTVGRVLYLKPDKASPSDTSMLAYIVTGELRPPRKKKFEMAVHVAHQLALPGGGVPKKQDVDTVMKALRDIDTHSWPVILETFDGQKFNVTLKLMREQLIGDSSGKDREYAVEIQAMEQIITG